MQPVNMLHCFVDLALVNDMLIYVQTDRATGWPLPSECGMLPT
jgi:hypothetical protein